MTPLAYKVAEWNTSKSKTYIPVSQFEEEFIQKHPGVCGYYPIYSLTEDTEMEYD
jgi:hypothetical protein